MTTFITPILETIVKSSIVLGFTFLATMALRRQSAALRHTVWTAGLLGALALPLFSLVLPAWHVEPIHAAQLSSNTFVSQPIVTVTGAIAVSPRSAAVPPTQSRFTPERVLMVLWLIGVLSVISLLLREAVRLARIAFGSSVVRQSTWQELAREISHALMLTRHVRLMRNPNASVLGTWGTLRPRVVLPRESESWSSERMRAVLGHEFAHVKRNDWLVQIIAESARAIYWFNPLFWVACTQLRRESEHACDDTAMKLGSQVGMDGPTYAGHVLDLARTLKHAGQPAFAALAMASTSNLERRLIAMLNPSLNRRITGKGTVVVVALFALALTLPLAALSSEPPTSVVTTIRTEEVAPQIPVAVFHTVTTAPPVVQRTTAQSAAEVSTARPAGIFAVVQVPAAQTLTGTLSGTVTDQSGAMLPGVRFYLTEVSGGQVQKAFSNDSGSFAFTQLAPGKYSITWDLPNFKTGTFLYVIPESGSNARLKITMQVAPISTAIAIATTAPPGLVCISVFGAFKSDGTPFTAADCPGGTIAAPVRSSAQSLIEPNATNGVRVDSSPATEPQRAIQPNGRPYPIRVGGDVQAGNLLSHPAPVYPADARSKGVEGSVTLSGIVTEDGHLRSLKIVNSSNPLLETSVLETIQYWTYIPTLLNKQPIEVATTITVHFMLLDR